MSSKEKKCEKKCDEKKCEKKPLTKNQIIAALAESTELHKKDVTKVLDALSELIQDSLSNKGAGSFTLPGLIKIGKKKVPAQPEKKGVPDPFHPGQTVDRPAKPAHSKVTVRALKALRDMA